MTSSRINSQSQPPLAIYKSIKDYTPNYSDYVVWAGWTTTWHGVVTNYDPNTQEVYIIFAGMPYLLFTMDENEQAKATRKIKLAKIRNSLRGSWSVLHSIREKNANVWYI